MLLKNFCLHVCPRTDTRDTLLSLKVCPLITAFLIWCLLSTHCHVTFNKMSFLYLHICACMFSHLCVFLKPQAVKRKPSGLNKQFANNTWQTIISTVFDVPEIVFQASEWTTRSFVRGQWFTGDGGPFNYSLMRPEKRRSSVESTEWEMRRLRSVKLLHFKKQFS